MMKKQFLKRLSLALCLTLLLGAAAVRPAYAASLYVSPGQRQVNVGDTFAVTVTVSSDVKAWTYSVTWSGNLTLVSGNTSPMGFDGENSHDNTLIFKANSVGTGTVTASCSDGLSDGTDDYSSSDSTSVQIVSVSSGGNGGSGGSSGGSSSVGSTGGGSSGSGSTSDSRNSNTALVSLGISQGTLSPAFDPAVTEYTVDLPSKVTALTVTAEASDSRTTVAGTGEVAVQTGENVIEVTATAENGDTRTYTIRATVAQAPSVFLDYQQEKLGVVKDVSKVTAPAGFTERTITVNGESIPCWVSSGGVTLLYLCDGGEVGGFYAYTQADGVLGPYQELTIGGSSYVYTGVPSDKRQLPGLVYGAVEVDGQKLNGFTYEDKAVEGFYVLYLTDGDGLSGYYTYDAQGKTLQRYNGAAYTDQALAAREQKLTQYLYIAAGTAAVLLLLVIVLLAALGRRKRMVKALQAQAAAGSRGTTPLETILSGGPAKEEAPKAAPADPAPETPAAEETVNVPEEPETKMPETEKAAPAEAVLPEETQGAPEEQPEQAADTERPEAGQTAARQAIHTEEAEQPKAEPEQAEKPAAEQAESAKETEKPAPMAPEEEAARRVTLDELLEDIHNM